MSPWKSRRPCATSNCPNLQPCALHPVRGRWEGRGSAASRGYGAEHRRWRAEVLARYVFGCPDPFGLHHGDYRPAVHADHIVPVADGGARYDPMNGQGLCKPCHDTKTGREGQARR